MFGTRQQRARDPFRLKALRLSSPPKRCEIEANCGSVIISAVAKRGNRSNHPIGRAVDVEGNPACVYAHLKD